MKTDKCQAQVYSGGAWNSHQCTRKATVHPGFCKQHSHEEREKKTKARQEKWNQELEVSRQQNLGPDAIRALKSVKFLLEKKMADSALDVVNAWLALNKF